MDMGQSDGVGLGARFTLTLLAVHEAVTLLTDRSPVGPKRRSRCFLRLSKTSGLSRVCRKMIHCRRYGSLAKVAASGDVECRRWR